MDSAGQYFVPKEKPNTQKKPASGTCKQSCSIAPIGDWYSPVRKFPRRLPFCPLPPQVRLSSLEEILRHREIDVLVSCTCGSDGEFLGIRDTHRSAFETRVYWLVGCCLLVLADTHSPDSPHREKSLSVWGQTHDRQTSRTKVEILLAKFYACKLMSWVSGTSKTSNTCLVEVTMRVPPDTEPTTEPPTKAEIILLQRAEEGLRIIKSSDAYLCQLIVCPG